MLKAFINSLASLWYGSPIEHGDKRRLWSYQSRSGGGYVQPLISAQKTSEEFLVNATGEAKDLAIVKFLEVDPTPTFKMAFEYDGRLFYLTASEHVVTASGNDTDTHFEIIQLLFPNQPFVVFRSNKKKDGKELYLSSDGAGDMKLKRWNAERGPRENSPEVDPALLFRIVEPIGKS